MLHKWDTKLLSLNRAAFAWINQIPDEFVSFRSTYTEQNRAFVVVVRNLIRREILLEPFGVLNPAVVLVEFPHFPNQCHGFVRTSSPV